MLDRIFVTVPMLRVEMCGETVSISNVAAGTAKRCGPEILELLEYFREPRKLRSWLTRPGASPQNVPTAISHAFMIDVDQLVTAEVGPIGSAMRVSELLAHEGRADTVIFGAPVDVASTGRGGARCGPMEIRKHMPLPFAAAGTAADAVYLDFEMRRQYSGPPPSIADLGSVAGLAGEGMATYGPRITLLSEMILEGGAVPGMLGGDHSCTAFALEAHLRHWPALGILHFDAHHDLWPPAGPQFDYVTHANVFHRSLGSPMLKAIRQLGLRVFEAASAHRLQDDSRVSFFSARELQRMEPEAAFAGLPRDIPYYLTFDIDCIDPIQAPETGTPLPGGLSYHQALDLVDYAAREFELVGWDIVEVGQASGAFNGAAGCAARLVRQLLLGNRQFEPLGAYTQPVSTSSRAPMDPASAVRRQPQLDGLGIWTGSSH
ncbi:MAG: arginase family protein [Sphingomonas sp.]